MRLNLILITILGATLWPGAMKLLSPPVAGPPFADKAINSQDRSFISVESWLNGLSLSGNAYAGDLNKPAVPHPKPFTIAAYYHKSKKAEDPALPDGLRVVRWGASTGQGEGVPVIASECLRFDSREFARIFFQPPLARRVRELFVEGGTDVGKLSNLIKAHNRTGKEVVCIFDEGYIIFIDPGAQSTYTLPIAPGMGKTLLQLTR